MSACLGLSILSFVIAVATAVFAAVVNRRLVRELKYARLLLNLRDATGHGGRTP